MWTAETASAEERFEHREESVGSSVEKKRVNPIEWKRSTKNIHVSLSLSLYIYIYIYIYI